MTYTMLKKKKNYIPHRLSVLIQRWPVCQTSRFPLWLPNTPRKQCHTTHLPINIQTFQVLQNHQCCIWACEGCEQLWGIRMLSSLSPSFLCEKVSWNKCNHLVWLCSPIQQNEYFFGTSDRSKASQERILWYSVGKNLCRVLKGSQMNQRRCLYELASRTQDRVTHP